MRLADLEVPDRGAGEAKDAIERVLARREFAEDEPTLLQRARDWVFDRVADVFEALGGGGTGTVVAWVIAIALTAAAAWFAYRLTRGLVRSPSAPGPAAPARRSAVDWRAEADAAEAAGDWHQALRCRYRALVADLADRGLVEEVPGRTAGEYRRQVGRNVPAAAPDFNGATELFEAAWYGGRPSGPAQADRFRDLADRVLAGAGARR